MLAKRIPPGKDEHGRPRHHNYRKLGPYCRDASHEGEKCLAYWHTGCQAEEYDLAVAEIVATQEMNTTATSDKTYHLMVSFRPEDEAKLTPEVCKEIELAFASALGLTEHQRVVGIHYNTNNLHMHIAYNLIHPEKLTMATSLKGDFFKLSQACRNMEQKFGLVVDNGMEARGDKQITQRAAAMEAHSGEKSFQSYAQEKKAQIVLAMDVAKDWQAAHRVFAAYGMEIRPQGNGFAIFNQGGKNKESIKASDLDKSLSKVKLVQRFGQYEKPEKSQNDVQKVPGASPAASSVTPGEKYEKNPIQPKSPERDQLWQEFQALAAERKAAIEAERERNKEAFGELRTQWARGRAKGAKLHMMRHIQKQDVAKAKAENQNRMAAIREKFPYHNWNGFLQYRAGHGDQAALKVLRSREGKQAVPNQVKAAAAATATKTWLHVPFTERQAAKDAGAKWDRGEKRWYAPGDADLGKFVAWLTEAKGTEKATSQTLKYIPDAKLSPSARIERLRIQEQQRIAAGFAEPPVFAGCKQRIDNRGVVIITLAGGGTVRDSGGKIHFSQDSQAKEAASLYALAKFGKLCKQAGTTIRRLDGDRSNITNAKPHIGILRESARNGLRKVSEIPLVSASKRPQKAELLLHNHAQSDLER